MSMHTKSGEAVSRRILDLEYGDEQERQRYYEVYAVVVHLELIVLPVAGAVVIGIVGRSAIVPVLAMLATVMATVIFGMNHLQRHVVRVEAIAADERNRVYTTAYVAAWLPLGAAIVARTGGSGLVGGFGMGMTAAFGVALGAVSFFSIIARRRRTVE